MQQQSALQPAARCKSVLFFMLKHLAMHIPITLPQRNKSGQIQLAPNLKIPHAFAHKVHHYPGNCLIAKLSSTTYKLRYFSSKKVLQTY